MVTQSLAEYDISKANNTEVWINFGQPDLSRLCGLKMEREMWVDRKDRIYV